jgi:hypothetical protein
MQQLYECSSLPRNGSMNKNLFLLEYVAFEETYFYTTLSRIYLMKNRV